MDISLESRMTAIAAVLTLMAGCASSGGGGPGPRVADFAFSVELTSSGGSVTNIDVKPNPAKEGLYEGGHARLEMKSNSPDAEITWESREPFWIKFEPLKGNKGQGVGAICDRSGQEPTTWTTATGTGPYNWKCTLKKGGGRTLSVKYHLADKNPDVDPHAIKLDPIIIVDR